MPIMAVQLLFDLAFSFCYPTFFVRRKVSQYYLFNYVWWKYRLYIREIDVDVWRDSMSFLDFQMWE